MYVSIRVDVLDFGLEWEYFNCQSFYTSGSEIYWTRLCINGESLRWGNTCSTIDWGQLLFDVWLFDSKHLTNKK